MAPWKREEPVLLTTRPMLVSRAAWCQEEAPTSGSSSGCACLDRPRRPSDGAWPPPGAPGPFSASGTGTTSTPPGSSRVHDSRLSGNPRDGTSDAALAPPIGRASGRAGPSAADSFGRSARAEARQGSPRAFRQPSRPHSPRARKVRMQSPALSQPADRPVAVVSQTDSHAATDTAPQRSS